MEERRKKRRQEGRRHKHHGRKISPLPEKRKKSAPLLAAFRLTVLFSPSLFREGEAPPRKKQCPYMVVVVL